MSKPSYSIHEATDAFMKALCKYQKATLDKQQAILKLNRHTLAMYEQLTSLVQTTESAIAPLRH